MRRVIVVAVGALALAGCATVTRGSSEQMQFDSTPAGAEVKMNLFTRCDAECRALHYGLAAETPRIGPACTTPCAVAVARSDVLVVTFAKPGYDPQTIRVEPQVQAGGAAGVAGNIILGGVTGLVIDGASGASLDHCPNPLRVVLRKTGSRDVVPALDMNCPPAPPMTQAERDAANQRRQAIN